MTEEEQKNLRADERLKAEDDAPLSSMIYTKINVESRLNHGSTFSFVLPLGLNKHSAASRPAVEETAAVV